jgi:hypothetical protein
MTDTKDAPKTTWNRNFNTAIRELLQTALKVHDEQYGNMSDKQQLWMVWTQKLLTAYTKTFAKVGNGDGFHGMFVRFYTDNSKDITVPIFVEKEDGNVEVNDKWLRCTDQMKGPGIKLRPLDKNAKPSKPSSEESWSPTIGRCKGHVIYFDDAPKHLAVSLPISEIYAIAMKLYKEKGSKDLACRTYPGKLLLYFYTVIYNVLPDFEEGKPIIEKNVKLLHDFIEQMTPTDSAVEGTGSGLAGIGRIMSQVMKAAGINASGFDEKEIGRSLSGALTDGAINGVGKVVGALVKSVQGDGKEAPKDIGDVVSGLGRALQSDTVKDAIRETAVATSALTGQLSASIPTADSLAGKTSGVALAPTPAPAMPSIKASTFTPAITGGDKLPMPSDVGMFDPATQE